jgi:predicted NAD-dependent protein-ADP-ribosyltransferase YbiA (DUF1768 family)
MSIVKDTREIKELTIQYNEYRKRCGGILDREEQKKCVEAAKKIKGQIEQITKEKKVSQENLQEFIFMKNVDSLVKLQKKMRDSSFWADVNAVTTLERLLNIKMILLSSESYREKDYANVVNCGELDEILMQRGTFTPDYYIMVEYTGQHYKLVGYNKKQIFTFKEIPYGIKKKIVDKCLERNSGVFSLIPDFVKFKEELSGIGLIPDVPATFDDLSDSTIKGLYDDNIVFSFYSNSDSKKQPGKGSGEKIPADMGRTFSELASIKDWRRKLDDSWIQPFPLDNKRWSSVEHYYQASKFKNEHTEFYFSFSIDSGTELSKDVKLAEAAGSKTGKFEKTVLRPKDIKVDSDFYGKRRDKEIYDAQYAKFSQNEDLKHVLLETKNAKLMHHISRKEPQVADSLMNIRDVLTKEGK